MNEYKGFKVGDKVEITNKSRLYDWYGEGIRQHINFPFVGLIENISQERFNNIPCVAVNISGYGLMFDDLLANDNIKKLPKYSADDIVRLDGVIATVLDTVNTLWTDGFYRVRIANGIDRTPHETNIIPFDGFRIGDTVFTVKRGKGKIFAQNSHDDRQFGVRWEIDAPLYTFPKTTNLIPTEAKYKEALNKAGYAFKIDVAYVQEYVAKPYFGQVQVAPSPKFKVGDAVYHKGNKLFVKRNMISCPQMVEVGNSCAGYTTVVAESDLRIWKETVLTHCLQSDGVTWSDGGPNGWDTKWYLKIEPLPNYTNPALFKVTTKSGNECIFRGIKGDDIS